MPAALFTADNGKLVFEAVKLNGSIRLSYQGWEDTRTVHPGDRFVLKMVRLVRSRASFCRRCVSIAWMGCARRKRRFCGPKQRPPPRAAPTAAVSKSALPSAAWHPNQQI